MDNLIFQWANTYALICWVILWFFPKSRLSRKWVRSGMAPFLLAILYVALIFSVFSSADQAVGMDSFSTLEGIAALFAGERALLTGWVHYLAFDMFVGIWIVGDAEKQGIKHLYIIPTLFFTFMLGPLGFLLYFIFRNYFKKQWLSEV